MKFFILPSFVIELCQRIELKLEIILLQILMSLYHCVPISNVYAVKSHTILIPDISYIVSLAPMSFSSLEAFEIYLNTFEIS